MITEDKGRPAPGGLSEPLTQIIPRVEGGRQDGDTGRLPRLSGRTPGDMHALHAGGGVEGVPSVSGADLPDVRGFQEIYERPGAVYDEKDGWFPLSRSADQLLQESELLMLYCRISRECNRARWSYGDHEEYGVWFNGVRFEHIAPRVYLFDAEGLCSEMAELIDPHDFALLFERGLLDFLHLAGGVTLGGPLGDFVQVEDGGRCPFSALRVAEPSRGFVKVPDALAELHANMVQLLAALHLKARYRPGHKVYRGRPYGLRRGQTVISCNELARELAVEPRQLNRLMHRAVGLGLLKKIPGRGCHLWQVS